MPRRWYWFDEKAAAKRAGVGIATVSRVLNGSERVAERTRELSVANQRLEEFAMTDEKTQDPQTQAEQEDGPFAAEFAVLEALKAEIESLKDQRLRALAEAESRRAAARRARGICSHSSGLGHKSPSFYDADDVAAMLAEKGLDKRPAGEYPLSTFNLQLSTVPRQRDCSLILFRPCLRQTSIAWVTNRIGVFSSERMTTVMSLVTLPTCRTSSAGRLWPRRRSCRTRCARPIGPDAKT